ncbi:MAG TPA: MBL fold metallo-hydrolase [Gemmatimonadales bacterium]|nr:MBL fold metallo-hydrolase [Gemmatimonadales bacterium]
MPQPPRSRPRHHLPGGGFRNPWLDGVPGRFTGLLRWLVIERLTKGRPPQPDPSAFPRRTPEFPAPRAGRDELVLTWVGHATFLVQIGGLNLLTDPVWSQRAFPVQWAGPRRLVPPGIAFDRLPPIDAVLLSHNHYDHLDAGTVRALARRHPDLRWLVPLGVGSLLRRLGARRVTELDWWEETRVDELQVGCTPAQHFSARGPLDRNRTLWCGWSIAAPARRVFFAGDTGLHPEFAAIGDRFGPFHAVLLPVGAYEPRWFMRPVHLDPEEALEAFRALHAARPPLPGKRVVMVPMHWGTFRLTDEPMDEPPGRTARAWAAAGLDPADLWILAHGETRRL